MLYGLNLAEMMSPVDEMEAAPLREGQGAQDEVRREASCAKELPGFAELSCEIGQSLVNEDDELFAVEGSCAPGRSDRRRSGSAGGELPQCHDGELSQPLGQRGRGLCGGTLVDALLDGAIGAAIGEEQVFDDLLNAPLLRRSG